MKTILNLLLFIGCFCTDGFSIMPRKYIMNKKQLGLLVDCVADKRVDFDFYIELLRKPNCIRVFTKSLYKEIDVTQLDCKHYIDSIGLEHLNIMAIHKYLQRTRITGIEYAIKNGLVVCRLTYGAHLFTNQVKGLVYDIDNVKCLKKYTDFKTESHAKRTVYFYRFYNDLAYKYPIP